MPEEVVILIMFGMALGLAWSVLGTIKAIALKKYEARAGVDPAGVRAELAELARRVATLEDGLLVRLQDVEERVDFTERLLAQQRARGHVGPGRE